MNPSTKRLLSIKVKRARGGEAIVGTTEYWYLRWWARGRRATSIPTAKPTTSFICCGSRRPEGIRKPEAAAPILSPLPMAFEERANALRSADLFTHFVLKGLIAGAKNIGAAHNGGLPNRVVVRVACNGWRN